MHTIRFTGFSKSLFVIYTSGPILCVTERVSGIQALPCVHDFGTMATKSIIRRIVRNQESGLGQTIDRSSRWELQWKLEFDTAKLKWLISHSNQAT